MPIEKGEILIDGLDTSTMPVASLRRQLASGASGIFEKGRVGVMRLLGHNPLGLLGLVCHYRSSRSSGPLRLPLFFEPPAPPRRLPPAQCAS